MGTSVLPSVRFVILVIEYWICFTRDLTFQVEQL